MKTRRHFLDDEGRERAALYALGTLPSEEAADYESHLRICEECRSEVRSLKSTLTDLPLAAPEAAPPPGLRARMFQRIRRMKQDEFVFAPASGAEWLPSGIPGIETRRLFHDAASDRLTMLVRMAPGSSYPAHRHSADEDCYVIEGDLTLNGVRMRAGDFVRAAAGSVHHFVSTERGCLLFIAAASHDELIPPPAAS